MPRRVRIFISYKRDVERDELLANRFAELLGKNHDVFIDRQMPIGTKWASRLDKELHKSDFLIAFLSAESVKSEMVLHEIESAHDLSRKCLNRHSYRR